MPEPIHDVESSIELHHSSIVEIMSKPPARIIRIGSSIILILFSMLIIGSFFFKFSDVIKVPVVITDNNVYSYLVSPSPGKIVKRIAQDKLAVNKGDTIFVIENFTTGNGFYYLISNLKGKVEMNPLWSIQSVVSINDTLGIIYEETLAQYFGITHLQSSQVGNIKVGNKVTINLDRFPANDYGVIDSRIRSISNFKNDNDYTILIDMPKHLYSSKGILLSTQGKLTGTADIIVNEKTVFERLLNPFRGLLSK